MSEILNRPDFDFCTRPGRCIVCGGELTEYEKRFDYPDHVNRSNCVVVLQNTLKQNGKNNDHSLALIGALVRLVEKYAPDIEPDWFEKLDAEIET